MAPDALALALDAVPLGDDPRRPVDYNARLVAEAVLATPYREAPGAVRPVPHAAHGLEPVDGGRRWRLCPDERLRWSDGTPLRAADLVAGIRDAAVRDRQTGRFLAEGDTAARELPDGRVEVHLREAAGFLPALLTLPQFAPLRPGSGAVLGPYAPDGTGPDGGPRFRRHPHAAGAGALPERLEFPVVAGLADAVAAFRAGRVQATPTTGFDLADTERYAGDPALVSAPVSVFASLEFGRRVPAVRRDPELRAAVAAALDREALAAGTRGLLEAAPAPVAALLGGDLPAAPEGPRRPPGSGVGSGVGSGSISGPGPAAVRAVRAAYAGAGPIEVAHADFVPNGSVVADVCARLREVFGLDVRPLALSYAAYVRAALTGDHALLYTLTTADFPHPAALLGPWAAGGTYSRTTGFSDPVFDRLFGEACRTTEGAEAAAWLAAEDRWLSLLPRVPLLRVRAHYLADPRVRAAGMTASGIIPPLGLGAVAVHR
ncbi:ABC transporter substrate-binding protein [Streptomyces sp. NPDC089799]|uniref:ABC transporter substrate-binding protein n=1 Tax=Streptomyces sp. NPDC089799 TaxID=3155066 RepID=UPI003423CC7D